MAPGRAPLAIWSPAGVDGDADITPMQYQLHSQTGSARYPLFYMRLWHNVLTLFIVTVANGLFWLVLLLWSALFKLVGIRFSAPFSLKLKALFM